MSNFFRFIRSKRYFRTGTMVWLLVAVSLSPLSFAHAYLDAGTGSYAIQVAIGVIFGATYTLKTFGGRIVQFIKGRGSKNQEDK